MIVVVGEALVDVVATSEPDDPSATRRARRPLEMLPGGGPANTALALARLGQSVELVTRLGKDAAGDLVADHLGRNGVGLRHLLRTHEPTTLSLIALGDKKDASYSFYFDATASWAWRLGDVPSSFGSDVDALHSGSMLLATPFGREVALAIFEREASKRTISLDPNVRLSVVDDLDAYRAGLEDALGFSHLVRVSDEDLGALYPNDKVEDAARRWADLGPRCVVVSRGAEAPLGLLGDQVVVGSPRTSHVIDTVGAGDTFSGALLDQLARASVLSHQLTGIDEAVLEEALHFAGAAAALTCARQGADPPTREEVLAVLRA